jgi:beta-lactamase regulating signal transducer with metallopeptidase domain
MSAPPVELGLGLLAELSVEAGVVLGVAQLLAWRIPRADQRHRLRAVALASIPVLAAIELGVDAPRLEGPGWVLGVWLAGVLAVLTPRLVSLAQLAVASSRARPGPEGSLVSDRVQVPLTWGVLRPLILLPEAAAGWSRSELDFALAHERAHIRRGDWAVQTLTELLCALMWFHPSVWWTRKELLLEAELAADRQVLDGGAQPTRYARHLLERFEGARAPLAATPGGRPSQLGARVRATLAPAGRPRTSALLFVLFPVLLGLSWLSPLPEAPPPTCEPTLEFR